MKYSLYLAIACSVLFAFSTANAQDIQLNFSTVSPTCFGYTDGTATVTATGGAGSYAYAWNNGQSGQTNLGLGFGTYTVTVSDQNGLTASASVQVNQPQPITGTITRSGFNCGVSGTLSAAGNGGSGSNYSFLWSTGEQTPSIQVNQSGLYFLTITDGNGCAGVANTFVAPPLQAQVLVDNIACSYYQNGGNVAAAVVGGATPYSFSWSNNVQQQSQQNLPAGTFTVTVTDGAGCTLSASGTITIPDPITANITINAPSCGGGNTGSATVQANGGTAPYTYNWVSLGLQGPTQNNLAAGNYYVCIFDANQCQLDILVVIPEGPGLSVSLALTKAECPGVNTGTATAIVTPAGNYHYAWNIQPGNFSQINGIPANTAVTVTVTDPLTGCQGTATGVVGTHNQVEVSVSDTDVACVGDMNGTAAAIASLGTAPYQYTWLFPDSSTVNGPNISSLGVGAYQVIVTDDRGCTAVGVADIGAGAAPNAAFQFDVLECVGSTVPVSFTDQSTDLLSTIVDWNWTITLQDGTVFTYNQANPPSMLLPQAATGVVQLTVSSATGCSSTVTDTFEVEGLPDFEVTFSTPTLTCDNLPVPISIQGDTSNTYVWFPTDGLTQTSDFSVTANPTETTTYYLAVSNGQCADTFNITITRIPDVQVQANAQTITTCETSAQLSAVASGDNPTYQWFDGNGALVGQNPNVSVPAGALIEYQVVATDAYGCTAADTVSVTGLSADVNLAQGQLTNACENTPLQVMVVNLDPSDTLTYAWSGPSNVNISPVDAPNPSVLAGAGVYTITVTASNQFGCTDTLSVDITFDQSASLSGQMEANLCNGLQVNFSNNSNISGTWNFGDNTTSTLQNPQHIYASAGAYTVSFLPNNATCIAAFDTLIQVQPTQAILANFDNSLLNCVNTATVQFTDVTVHNTTLLGWQWSFSNSQTSDLQNPTVVFDNQGAYSATLIVTDANGCKDTVTNTIQVDVINESLNERAEICPGTTIALNPQFDGNYAYVWTATPNDPNLDIHAPNPVVSPVDSTLYSVLITNGACSASFDALVVVLPPAMVELTENYVVCSNAPVTLSVMNSNVSNFEWADNPAFNPVLPSNGGSVTVVPGPKSVYYVMAITAEGCLGFDSIMVDNQSLGLELGPTDQQICEGESVALIVNNLVPAHNVTYTWSPALPPVGNPTVSPVSSMSYQVVASNQFNCRDTVQFNIGVTMVAVDVAVMDKDTVCEGETSSLLATVTSNSNNITYSWTPSGTLSDPTIADPKAQPTETTLYTVTVAADDRCFDTASLRIVFFPCECVDPFIFVPKAFTPNGDTNNDYFIVRGVNITEMEFIVWDRWGEIVYRTTDPEALGWDGTYKGIPSPPDAYAWYLEARCGNGALYKNKGDVTLLR